MEVLNYQMPEYTPHPCPKNMDDSRKIAQEGIVLLRNENHTLPLSDKKVALYGSGAVDTVFCGTGSGYVSAERKITVMQGLLDAGFEITSSAWLNRFEETHKKVNDEDKTISQMQRFWGGYAIRTDDIEITAEDINEGIEASTAIYVIRRNAGEEDERKEKKGDYYLSNQELMNIELVAETFEHTVIVFNSTVMDANFIYDIRGIDAALLVGPAGNDLGAALASILTGETTPSGHLTDTWAKNYRDYPASETFGVNDGNVEQEDYREDIYVGYRYFDSFGLDVIYPFGFGLSYTEFQVNTLSVKADFQNVNMRISVKNIGTYSGKEVIQVYASKPRGNLKKCYQDFVAYNKTGLLAPGEEEVLDISFPKEYLSSYDENRGAFVMESGDYKLRVGSHSRKTEIVAILELDEDATVRQVSNKVCPDRKLDYMEASKIISMPWMNEDETKAVRISLRASDCKTINGLLPKISSWNYKEVNKDATLLDVYEKKSSMEDFVNSLDEEVLYRLVAGASSETPHSVESRFDGDCHPIEGPRSSGETTSLYVNSLGIPNLRVSDGPAGCHLFFCGVTDYPSGIVLAQTFNDELADLMGQDIAKELDAYNFDIILGPALNIHRAPLGGRNYEYYSEDPVLSGKIAAAYTRGVQSRPGFGVSIKHFACNNQEANRLEQNSIVSERALREIYLRGFEICVRESNPATVMTSYNKLNGIHTSSHRELVTGILREEWGFQGLVMTDWGSTSTKADDLFAGNDLIMGGYRPEFFKAAVHGIAPEFREDGYVLTEEFHVYGGFFTNKVEHWNRFVPDAKGTETISTIVKNGVELNSSVYEKVKENIATVTENEDHSHTVTYKGFDRGACLDLNDVRLCASRTLKLLMQSKCFEKMQKEL